MKAATGYSIEVYQASSGRWGFVLRTARATQEDWPLYTDPWDSWRVGQDEIDSGAKYRTADKAALKGAKIIAANVEAIIVRRIRSAHKDMTALKVEL